MIALKRAAFSGSCLLALPAAGCRDDVAADTRFNVQVVVQDCYTAFAGAVSIDGSPLALVPAARRDDSVAVCYDRPRSLGRRSEVRIRTARADRRVTISPTAESRFLVIMPDRAPYAVLTRDRPLLD